MPGAYPTSVPLWDVFDLALPGPGGGNPFVDVSLSARFQHRNRILEAEGFYDGDGIFRVRFMPDETGEWRFLTSSSQHALDGHSGAFVCDEPQAGVHGPVQVHDTFHFAYADGLRYVPIGTTCYAWTHQTPALEEQTLATLATGPFNKIRMCVFPKHYAYNHNEPALYPFAGAPLRDWDFTRFNPAFFQHFERRVQQLMALGIEADIILFHPYDRWGFAAMPADADDRYLRYVVARLSAYRNVWWSLANEFDLMTTKTEGDWDRFFHILQEYDPAQHLRSIHNCHAFYNHAKPWVTHASIQRWDVELTNDWRAHYRKPVVIDECGYEGNIAERWGSFTPQEHLRKFWVGSCRGGYVGHSETYWNPEDTMWWSKGGELRGQSPERIAFLRRLLEQAPGGLEPTTRYGVFSAHCGDDYHLVYQESHQGRQLVYELPEGADFTVDIIDTWEMTINRLPGVVRGKAIVDTPTKPYIAVRFQKA